MKYPFNDVAQEPDASPKEMAFLRCQLKPMSSQPLKDHFESVQGFLFIWGKDQNIVKVAQQGQEVLVSEDTHHEAHETRWAVAQALG